MRWITAHSVSGSEIYQLFKGEKKLLTLTFNPFSSSARIEFDSEKRVFLVRKEGFRRRKTVLRSEYGVKIGELGHEHKQDFIDVNGDRFYYSTRNNPRPELVLYKESVNEPLITCSLNSEDGNASVAYSHDSSKTFSFLGLLIALCWYMFLPEKEGVTQFVS